VPPRTPASVVRVRTVAPLIWPYRHFPRGALLPISPPQNAVLPTALAVSLAFIIVGLLCFKGSFDWSAWGTRMAAAVHSPLRRTRNGAQASGPLGVRLAPGIARTNRRRERPNNSSSSQNTYLRPLLKSEKGSAGVSKSPTPLKTGFQQQQLPSQLRQLLVFPSQRPPSRIPQLRRGATTAAGCETSSAGPSHAPF
jgi:hypothetical protein